MRRRAWLCLLVASPLVAGCSGDGATDREPADADAARTSVREKSRWSDPHYGWTVSFPERFRVASVERRGWSYFSGAAIANFPLDGDPLRVLEEAPSDGVAVVIGREVGDRNVTRPEARFPLNLADFASATGARARVARRLLLFSANGWEFVANAYLGRDATRQDREALGKVVASLRFPPLEEGGVTGDGFYVLGPSERYAVGSVTRFAEADLPREPSVWRRRFFLIRAPGGLYAVGHTANLSGGFPACRLRFDRTHFQFFCRNGARWDRVGRVIRNPDPARFRDDPLALFVTKVAQDGHVLVSPNTYRSAYDSLARRLWPSR